MTRISILTYWITLPMICYSQSLSYVYWEIGSMPQISTENTEEEEGPPATVMSGTCN